MTRDDEFSAIEWAGLTAPFRKTPGIFAGDMHHPSGIVLAVLDGGAAASLMARIAEHEAAARCDRRLPGGTGVLARTGPTLQALLEEFDAEYAEIVAPVSTWCSRAPAAPVDRTGWMSFRIISNRSSVATCASGSR